MKRPNLNRAEVENYIKQLPPEDVYLVGIRGYYKNSMGKEKENDRGIYDDAIILVTPNEIFTYNANTDPSKYKPGIAKLIPGIHQYRKGKHGISKPSGAYPALRPATPDESLLVTRDGKEGIHKGIAINIHKGGAIYTNSAGCQTIHPTQWLEFINRVYKAMDNAGQSKIPYVLIEN